MPLTFGTSGLRGLVSELDSETVMRWTKAYLASCPASGPLYIGRDLRPSSPEIADAVMSAAEAVGVSTIDCGQLPTPALALVAKYNSAVMVTGSHIPADRNGLKLYVPHGEISKSDEAAITAAFSDEHSPETRARGKRKCLNAGEKFVQRYISAFGKLALSRLKIGVYEHSSVARDLLSEVLKELGADVIPIARSDQFIPVDTEAVDTQTREMFADWCNRYQLDALVSTDGDGDRPMVTDASGRVIPGDVLGVLTTQAVGASHVVTPISSNSMVTQVFGETTLTRIGSPFVIASMEAVLDDKPDARVVGFEANGGFLLGFDAEGPSGPLPTLMTRDSFLPIIAPLAIAVSNGKSIADLVSSLPTRFTAADRLQDIERGKALSLIEELKNEPLCRSILAPLGYFASMDQTDGLRISFSDGRIIHFRPSGNAPEFRVYAEAESEEAATDLLYAGMALVKARLLSSRAE